MEEEGESDKRGKYPFEFGKLWDSLAHFSLRVFRTRMRQYPPFLAALFVFDYLMRRSMFHQVCRRRARGGKWIK
jgi:hypothetical protein